MHSMPQCLATKGDSKHESTNCVCDSKNHEKWDDGMALQPTTKNTNNNCGHDKKEFSESKKLRSSKASEIEGEGDQIFLVCLIRESVDSLCRDGADTPIA